jgi:hypothetical protein
VLANIRQPTEEPPIATKVALPARTSVTPPMQPNTITLTIVPFAVRVPIRQPPEDKPIVTKVALPARISVTPPLQQNTIILTIAKFAMLVNIQQPSEEPPFAIVAVLVRTSVIPIMQPNTTKKSIV